MPKQKPAPQLTRVSPGVYRDASGNLVRSTTGQAPAPKAAPKPQQPAGPKTVGQKLQKAERTQKAKNIYNAEIAGADAEVQRGTVLTNPNQYNPFGQQTVEIDPATGQPIVRQELSQSQQQILDQQQGLSTQGGEMALDLLSQQGRFNPADFGAERDRIEGDIYDRLTRDIDVQQQRSTDQVAQSLRDRGIPYSNDPNSRYQQEMKDITQRFDDQRLNARRTATEMGGQELSRQFGIGQATHQQQIGDIGTYGSMGSGMILPNFQQFQAGQYNPMNAGEIYFGNQQLDINRQQMAADQAYRNAQLAAMNRPSGGQPQTAPPAFDPSTAAATQGGRIAAPMGMNANTGYAGGSLPRQRNAAGNGGFYGGL